MWNVIHRTHGGDAFLKKSLKKQLTFVLRDDILIKLSHETAESKRTLKIEQQEETRIKPLYSFE